MRRLILLGLLGVGGIASASFDLILVADNSGSFSGPTSNKIHRYDGDSGVYLGSFDTGGAQIYGMAVNKAANEVYVSTEYSHLLVMDYNTGALKADLSVNAPALQFYNGALYRASGISIHRVNVTTGALTPYLTWSEAITEFGFTASGRLAVYGAATGHLQGFSSSLVAGGMVTLSGYSTTATARLSGDFGASDRITVMGGGSVNPTATYYSGYTITSAGNLSFAGSGSYFLSFTNNFVDIAPAHTGYWMLGKNNGGANMLYRMSSDVSNSTKFITTSQVTTPGPIAVVLAPEPGTMAALGLGLVALLKRRKKA